MGTGSIQAKSQETMTLYKGQKAPYTGILQPEDSYDNMLNDAQTAKMWAEQYTSKQLADPIIERDDDGSWASAITGFFVGLGIGYIAASTRPK